MTAYVLILLAYLLILFYLLFKYPLLPSMPYDTRPYCDFRAFSVSKNVEESMAINQEAI